MNCATTRCGRPGCGACRLIARDPAFAAGFARTSARSVRRRTPPPPGCEVGTELEKLLGGLGLGVSKSCGCAKWRRRMNAWGPTGCRANRAAIEAHLRTEAGKVGWAAKLAAGAKAVAAGLLLNPIDPAPGLLDEAIRRAEVTPPAPAPLVPPLRLVPVGPAGLAARPNGYAFNASLIRHRGRLLLAHRDGWAGSDIHVAELADDYRVLRPTRLALVHLRAAVGREDPRLFLAGDELRLHFIGVERDRGRIRTSQMYARLNDDLTVRSVHYPELAGRQEPMEKNWSPFFHEGEHLAVYQTGPRHVVIRIAGDRAERVADTPVDLPWAGGVMRGGAPPVRVGDHYYHWFHGKTGPDRSPHYNVGLAVFEARPPFRVVALSPRPMLWASAADNAAHPHPNYCAVSFPCGSLLEGGLWKVSMGWNDRGVRVAEWDAAAVDAVLGPHLAGSPGPPAPG